ncbi:putative Tetratricopeptide repeat protein [Candidatus Zixiibacteriota bacterium]|nr:putative Tetratricopeptide repeat protein [candidate division Zixibacteria bacterium]
MESIVVIFLLALISLIFIYIYYDRIKKEKKVKDPTTYIEALKSLLDGQEETAFAGFREVVAEDSTNVDAYVRIGDILRKYGKPDKALQVHKDLTLRHGLSSGEKSTILRSLADDFFALGDMASAMAAIKELISIDGNNKWATERMLDVYAQTGDWDAAFEMKEKLTKIEGGKGKKELAFYKFFQGEKLTAQKEYHKARLHFKEAIGIDPACVPAYIYIGDSYLSENREEDAVEFWQKLIKVMPDASKYVLGRLKKALFDLGRFGEISSICTEILEVSPKNLEARMTLAEYHYKKGEYSIASEHLSQAAEDHPDSYLPILDLAKLYLTIGDKRHLGELINKLEDRRELIENQYHCDRCGYKSKTKKWFCPSCKAIDSFVV